MAKNCRIKKNTIYFADRVDTSCKQLILPDIEVEEGSSLAFACTRVNLNHAYGVDHDSVIIIGDVTMTHSKDRHNNYKFKTEVYFDKTKLFHINKTVRTHATIHNLKFIGKKLDQVHIACEYF